MTTFLEKCFNLIASLDQRVEGELEPSHRRGEPRGRIKCEEFACGACRESFSSFAALRVHVDTCVRRVRR